MKNAEISPRTYFFSQEDHSKGLLLELDHADSEDLKAEVPSAPIPLLPLANTVLFPFMVIPLQINRHSSMDLVEDAIRDNRRVGIVAQTNEEEQGDSPPQVYSVGTLAEILKMLRYPDGAMMILVRGIDRFRIVEKVQDEPYLKAYLEILESTEEDSLEIEALLNNLKTQFRHFIELAPHLSDEVNTALENTHGCGQVADFILSNLNLSVTEKQKGLEELDVKKRLGFVTESLYKEIEVLQLGTKIQNQVQEEMTRNQREYLLREQIKAIQHELGQDEDESPDLAEIRQRLANKQLPEHVRAAADRELKRLARIPQSASEYSVTRTYLDWIVDLPWCSSTKKRLSMSQAQTILDEDHYGLKKVKDRILEYLAVRKLRHDSKGSILCLVGPPGVGKTSLGKSVARATGRKFIRMSLGGVHDEAEIRGHRRTYVGALPGRIIQGLRNAGSNNPVFMLDEIDKLSSDFRGDPASALLEVLDPEQNDSFADHYLDLEFDLSGVMFICTANVADTIPHPLLDRMELIELPGYTEDEKYEIARRYLEPKIIKATGLKPKHLNFSKNALLDLIRYYTREAGVRNLEREMGAVARKIARQVASGDKNIRVNLTPALISGYLGPPAYYYEVAERTALAGVATGLAWTSAGGDILFVEATRHPGKQTLKLTGQIGDVMQESAQAAFSYLQSNAAKLSLSNNAFKNHDFHVHIPAGAIPKDGPSAGITLLTALYSLLSDRPVRHDVAMTGELSLRGKVLPVGGIKSKLLAAKRAGIKTVILPQRNAKDLEDLEPQQRKGLKFIFVETVDEVLHVALED